MPDRDAVQITEVGKRAAVRVKAWSRAGISAPGSAAEPLEAGRSAASIVPPGLGGQVRVLNFAPREWLVVSEAIEGPRLAEHLGQHLGGQGMAVVDLSCAFKALRVEGPAARELLSKGCGLDLHPRAFPAGLASRTRFAQLPVIVDCTDPKPCFNLYVGRSYLQYLRSRLIDVAVEFQQAPA
jgi:sarcosine oxidase, subunit gamma